MAYKKTVWVNDSKPAINADNLNKIELGIEANDAAITENTTAISTETARATAAEEANAAAASIAINTAGNLQTEIDTLTATVGTKADQTDVTSTNAKLIRDVTAITVPASAFVADTTFTNYPYKADITVSGATSNDVPDVQPSQDAMDLNILGGKSLAGAGIVTIYANAVPSAAIVIDRITLRKENA